MDPSSDGGQDWVAENPPYGAVFTYYLQEPLKSLEQLRQEAEREKREAEEPVFYPEWDDLRAEEREEVPQVLLTVKDADGAVIRRVPGPTGAGIQRVNWNLRLPARGPAEPVDATERSPWEPVEDGPLALAGTYTVELHQRLRGEETLLAGPVEFVVRDLDRNPMAGDQQQKLAFEREVQGLVREVEAAAREYRLAMDRLARLRTAAAAVGGPDLQGRIGELENELRDLWITLNGDRTVARRNEPTPMSVRQRLGRISWAMRATTMGPTATQRQNLQWAEQEFAAVEPDLTRILEADLPRLVEDLEQLGAPYTCGGDHLVPENECGDEARRWKRF